MYVHGRRKQILEKQKNKTPKNTVIIWHGNKIHIYI